MSIPVLCNAVNRSGCKIAHQQAAVVPGEQMLRVAQAGKEGRDFTRGVVAIGGLSPGVIFTWTTSPVFHSADQQDAAHPTDRDAGRRRPRRKERHRRACRSAALLPGVARPTGSRSPAAWPAKVGAGDDQVQFVGRIAFIDGIVADLGRPDASLSINRVPVGALETGRQHAVGWWHPGRRQRPERGRTGAVVLPSGCYFVVDNLPVCVSRSAHRSNRPVEYIGQHLVGGRQPKHRRRWGRPASARPTRSRMPLCAATPVGFISPSSCTRGRRCLG